MNNFDKKIRKLLKQSNWSINRRVPVERYCTLWSKYNFLIFPKAVSFVENFGEVSLQDVIYSDFKKTNILVKVNFFPLIATENIAETGWIEQCYSPLAQENLLPVGTTFNDYMTIMIGESGKFYGGYDDFFAILGLNKKEMLMNIFNGYDFEILNQ